MGPSKKGRDYRGNAPRVKGLKEFILPRTIRRYVDLKEGELSIKEKVIAEETRYDGKWVLRTNTALPSEKVAQIYKSLPKIERTFRELKSGLEINPVLLRTENHIRGHIIICFLALLLEAALIERLNREIKCRPLFQTGNKLASQQA